MKYRIVTRELIGSEYEVEANSEEEAIDKLVDPIKVKTIEFDYDIEKIT